MRKILFITNIANRIGSFSVASIESAKELNLQFHIAAKWNATEDQIDIEENKFNVKIHNIDLVRSPYSIKNYTAYKQLIKIIKEEKIDFIHCNTPIGGLLGRFGGKKCKVKKVIYQAHGFHFYKGAPWKNWVLYYPIEKWLAHYTDALITINHEDYDIAKKFHLRNNGKVYYVPGVGIDTSEYIQRGFQRNAKRLELGLKDSDIMVISTGDLIERKNYKTAIESIAKARMSEIQYFICGQGPLKGELKQLAERLGVSSQIHFLGYRTDVKELLWASDIFLFTTYQEGLPRSLSEAMATGLPCLASRIRGNTDLMIEGESGYLYEPTDVDGFADALRRLAEDDELRTYIGEANIRRIEEFNVDAVRDAIKNIYQSEMKDILWRH